MVAPPLCPTVHNFAKMVYCCAQLCKSKSSSKRSKSTEKLSFHEFPANLERRAVWIKNVARKDWLPSDSQRLCSKHFTDDQYKVGKKHSYLLPTAVPTIFEGRKSPSRQSKSPPSKKPKRPRKTKATTDSKDTNFSSVPSETEEIAGMAEDPKLAKTLCETAENGKRNNSLETSSGMGETAKNSTCPMLLERSRETEASTINGKNPEFPEVHSESPLAPECGNARRIIVVSKGTTETAENGKRFRLMEIPRRRGETAKHGKKYTLLEIPSETVEHAKNAKNLKLSTISDATANVCKTSKLPNVPAKQKVDTEIPWPDDVEHHLAIERKLKANQKMIYRLRAKIGSQKNEIASLKATLQKFTSMPLLEKVQNIEQAAGEDKLHAKFLLCQIKGYGKKRILWDDKLVRCFKHWRAMSGKGYDFPRTCGLLRLPHPSSLGRYADSSQADAIISSVIENLGQGPEVMSEEIHDATYLFDDCEVAVATIPSGDCSDVVDSNPIDQFQYIL